MAANKTLNKTHREERLAEVASMYRRGLTQTEIAKALGVSQPQVAYDVRIIRVRYQETLLEDHGAMVQEKLDQYRDVRREAWEAWERSKGDADMVVEEYVAAEDQDRDGASAEDGSERRIKRVVTTGVRLPDNTYLLTILKALEAERQLLGLNEAKKLAATVSTLDWTPFCH